MANKTFVGDQKDLKQQLSDFTKFYQPDEIMVSGNIYDFDKKLKSYEMAAEVIQGL